MNGTRINIESYKRDILNLKELSDKKLDFDWVDGTEYTIGDEVVLTDRNGILSDYEVYSNYSNISINGNNLIIKVANKVGNDTIKLKRKR